MKFEITPEQFAKIAKWKKEIDAKVIAKQKESMAEQEFAVLTANGQYPYYGAIGGSLTYSFSTTSLGEIVKVVHEYTQEQMDVTNYDEW